MSAHVGPSWPHLGRSWGQLGVILGLLGATLGALGPKLGYLRPSWRYILGPKSSENARDIAKKREDGDANSMSLRRLLFNLGVFSSSGDLEPSWDHLGPS